VSVIYLGSGLLQYKNDIWIAFNMPSQAGIGFNTPPPQISSRHPINSKIGRFKHRTDLRHNYTLQRKWTYNKWNAVSIYIYKTNGRAIWKLVFMRIIYMWINHHNRNIIIIRYGLRRIILRYMRTIKRWSHTDNRIFPYIYIAVNHHTSFY